jgi:hypothetical protein
LVKPARENKFSDILESNASALGIRKSPQLGACVGYFDEVVVGLRFAPTYSTLATRIDLRDQLFFNFFQNRHSSQPF